MSDDQSIAAFTAPLLNQEDAKAEDSICPEDVKAEDSICRNQAWQAWRASLSQAPEEIKQLCMIALPMILTGLLVYGKSAITICFMGKLGKQALAGGSLAISLANISGYSVISGLAMGSEPISSQACGAKRWSLMAQTLLRTIVILAIACIPISFLWLYSKPLLLFLHQDPVISSIASTYLAFSLPDLIFLSLINPLKIYLRTQNITLPLMVSAAVALALHAPINYFFVYHLKLGIRGIALATALTDLNLLAAILVYLCRSGTCRKSWQGLSLGCNSEWRSILVLALPSCASVCLEWWWYEIMIFLSGLLSNGADALATMGVLIQATALIYIFPMALSQAVSTRVGNELGANSPSKAKSSSTIALSCATFTGVIAMVFMTTVRTVWGKVFTKDEAIVSLTAMCMPVVGLCELGNSPQTTGCGVLRGSARPTLGANINLGSFYGVGLPVAVSLGFCTNLGLLGLWLGLLAAQLVCSVAMVTVLAKTDWTVQANRARELTGVNLQRAESPSEDLTSVSVLN